MHPCPGPGAIHGQPNPVPDDMLACNRHWYQVDKATQRRVYATWAHGAGAGTAGHLAAMTAAVTQMTELPPPTTAGSRTKL